MISEDTHLRKPTLEDLRKSAGMSRAQLALAIGLKEATSIYDLERKGALPRLDRAVALARALGVSLKTVCESLGLDVEGIPDDFPTESA
jgi:transcriptional regulator with XRE-family HTH domain